MTESRRCDLVVVGTGVAGLNAALAAANAGLNVVVLEKADKAGGASCWSYGATWVPCSRQAEAAGIADSVEAAEAYLNFLGSGEQDPSRTSAVTCHGARILAEQEAAGLAFDLVPGVNDILFGTAPGAVAQGRHHEPRPMLGRVLGDWRERLQTPPDDESWRLPKAFVARAPNPGVIDAAIAEAKENDQLAQGPAIVAGLLVALRERGVPVLFDTPALSLIMDQAKERVAGVRTPHGEYLASTAVFLGTGSYGANKQLVASIDKLPEYRKYLPATANGDGLIMASKAGAAIRQTRNNLVVMLGFDNPADPQGLQAGAPSTRELPRAHTMVVNAAGKRFGSESNFQHLSRHIRELNWETRQPRNLPCWMIVDQQYVAKWGLAGSAPGTVPSFVMRAATLNGLAVEAGIDPEGLVGTAARMNHFAETGVDEDFNRKPGWAMVPGHGGGKNPSLGSISQAPFYALRLYPTMGVVGGGIKADAAGRVLDWHNQAIAGLYCAGDAALHDEFGAGYQAGVTQTSAMVFAWLAVDDMLSGRSAA